MSVAQALDPVVDHRVQQCDAALAEPCVQRQLRLFPGALRLRLLGASFGRCLDQPGAPIAPRPLLKPALRHEGLQIASQRGGIHAHAARQIGWADRPQLEGLGQQRVLRRLQAGWDHVFVVVTRHDPTELTQLEVGTAPRLDKTAHAIYCTYKSCIYKCCGRDHCALSRSSAASPLKTSFDELRGMACAQ